MSNIAPSKPKPKRSDMPILSGFLDELRANLGDLYEGVKVVYAKEGEFEVGKQSGDVGVVPCIDEYALKKAALDLAKPAKRR